MIAITVESAKEYAAGKCEVCGSGLKKVHCTFLCPNCGFSTDCSDL